MQGGSVGKVSEAYMHHSYTHPETRGPPFIVILHPSITQLGLPWWLSGKESMCDVGDAGHSGSIPGSGRSPGGGHGHALQYSCQENPTEEPGGLQSTGPQRVRHDWVIEHIIQLLPALCPQGRGKSNSLERRTACERNHDSKPGLLHPAPTLWTSALYLNICSLGISRHSNFRGHLAPNVQVGWPRLALCLGKRDGRAASP